MRVFDIGDDIKGAVIYSRVSPQPRLERKEATIQSQIEMCIKHCDVRGLKVLGTYTDKGVSGAKSAEERPGLKKAMEQCCQEPAVLVAYSLDRVTRSVREAARVVDELGKGGAQLCLIKESIDTTTYTGRFVFTMFSALAEMERERIAERTRDAMLSRLERGEDLTGNQPPFGYCYGEDNNMYVYPPEQKTLKALHRMRKAGAGCTAIARELAAKGHLTRAGTVPNRNWVDSLLRREAKRSGRKYGCKGKIPEGVKMRPPNRHFPGPPRKGAGEQWLTDVD